MLFRWSLIYVRIATLRLGLRCSHVGWWRTAACLHSALAIDRLAYVTSKSGVGLQNRDADTSITNNPNNFAQNNAKRTKNRSPTHTHRSHIYSIGVNEVREKVT